MSPETHRPSVPEFPKYGERPGEVETLFDCLAEGTLYRAWCKAGSAILAFESKLVRIDAEEIPPSEKEKRIGIIVLHFENGVSVTSRNGWGTHFYRKERP